MIPKNIKTITSDEIFLKSITPVKYYKNMLKEYLFTSKNCSRKIKFGSKNYFPENWLLKNNAIN